MCKLKLFCTFVTDWSYFACYLLAVFEIRTITDETNMLCEWNMEVCSAIYNLH